MQRPAGSKRGFVPLQEKMGHWLGLAQCQQPGTLIFELQLLIGEGGATDPRDEFKLNKTSPAAFFPLGEVLETVGGSPLSLLVLLHVPRQLGGDVGDEEAAGAKAVGVISELIAHVHQVVVGVDVVEAVGFSLPRGLAHVFAVPKETVEVEFVGSHSLLLELEEARLDLRLGVLQGSGGHRGGGRPGPRDGKLRHGRSQLFPGQERGSGRHASWTRGGPLCG
ncbi:hypothetical protein E2320_006304 [Naja naja]|nr:hypothetical protein E2320_006304 [Naja naja]